MMNDLKTYLTNKYPKATQVVKQVGESVGNTVQRIKKGLIKTAEAITPVRLSDAYKSWKQKNGTRFVTRALAFTLVGAFGLGAAGCAVQDRIDHIIDEDGMCGCKKCKDSIVQEYRPTTPPPEIEIVETLPEEDPAVIYEQNVTKEDVMSSYDVIASEILRHQLLENELISDYDQFDAQLVAICPPSQNGQTGDFREVNGKYQATLIVSASINGGQARNYTVDEFYIDAGVAPHVFALNDSHLVPRKEQDGSYTYPVSQGDMITRQDIINKLATLNQNDLNNHHYSVASSITATNFNKNGPANDVNCMGN